MASLDFRAVVPEDSYLFVWAGEGKYVSPRIFLDELKTRLERGHIDDIEHILNRFVRGWKEMLGGQPGVLRSPPSYDETKYFIPASSLKGAVRSRLEYKFRPVNVGGRSVSRSCYIIQGPPEGSERHLKFWGVDSARPREGPCDATERDEVCAVCDLFGAPSLASRLNFSDAVLESGGLEELGDLRIRAFRPGCIFRFSCTMFNASWEELGLTFMAMELKTKSPLLIGFKKYVYNRVVGAPYRKRYYFGLLKPSLERLALYDAMMEKREEDPREALERAFDALTHSPYKDYLDFEKGVIRQ